MTEEQHNKFLTLLMGGHWHEGIIYSDGHQSKYKCICMDYQSIEPLHRLNPDHLANPLPVLKWMREHMEVRLESYINWCDSDHKRRINVFFDVLDLRNLVQYLKEHTEAPFMWGFTPCPSFPSCMSGETDKCDFPDKGCEGNGEVRGHIHPALQFLRSIKEVEG